MDPMTEERLAEMEERAGCSARRLKDGTYSREQDLDFLPHQVVALVAEVRRLREENTRMRGLSCRDEDSILAADEEIGRLREENARLRALHDDADPLDFSERLLLAASLVERAAKLIAETSRPRDALASQALSERSSDLEIIARSIRHVEIAVEAASKGGSVMDEAKLIGMLGEADDAESSLEWRYQSAARLAQNIRDLVAEVRCLRELDALSDKIIAERNRLLDALPCPMHGQCVPHALKEVERLREENARLRRLADNPAVVDAGISGLMSEWGGDPEDIDRRMVVATLRAALVAVDCKHDGETYANDEHGCTFCRKCEAQLSGPKDVEVG